MTKLKVGQKYRIIKDCSMPTMYNGKIVIVKEIINSGAFLDKDEGRRYIINDDDKDEILELIKDKKVKGVSKKEILLGWDSGSEDKTVKVYGYLDKQGSIKITKVESLDKLLEEPKKESKEIKKLKYVTIKRNGIPAICRSPDTDEITDKINELVSQVNKLSKEK